MSRNSRQRPILIVEPWYCNKILYNNNYYDNLIETTIFRQLIELSTFFLCFSHSPVCLRLCDFTIRLDYCAVSQYDDNFLLRRTSNEKWFEMCEPHGQKGSQLVNADFIHPYVTKERSTNMKLAFLQASWLQRKIGVLLNSISAWDSGFFVEGFCVECSCQNELHRI